MWSNRQKLHDAEAERARQHLPEPTMPWQAPGARVVALGGPPGDRVGGAVSVGSLNTRNLHRFERAGADPVPALTGAGRVALPMGISLSSLVCGEPEPEEVTVEHGDSVPNAKAIHAAIAAGLAAASGGRNDELQAKPLDHLRPNNPQSLGLNHLQSSRDVPAACQADLGWRISGPLGHSTVAEPQDLEGPCVDLRANELWIVVPTDAFLARLPNLSPKVQEGDTLVLWRGLVI